MKRMPTSWRPRAGSRSSGFTLVEMMASVAIAGVLISIGMPAMSEFIRNQAVATASFDVTSMLTFARSEAIKRNTNVVVTQASGDWKNGWTVDVTANGATTTLRTQAAFKNELTIDSSVSSFTYGGNGRVQGSTTPTFEIKGGERTQCVTASLSGLPNSKKGAC